MARVLNKRSFPFFLLFSIPMILTVGCPPSSSKTQKNEKDTLAVIPHTKPRIETRWQENITQEKHEELKALATSYTAQSVQVRHLPQKQGFLRFSYPKSLLGDSLWGMPFGERKSAVCSTNTSATVNHTFFHLNSQLLDRLSTLLSNQWFAIGLSHLVQLDYPTMTKLHETRIYLEGNPDFYTSFRKELLKKKNSQIHRMSTPSGIDPYAVSFWVRRDLDGTAPHIESILHSLLTEKALWSVWRKQVVEPGRGTNNHTTTEFHPWYPKPMQVGAVSKTVFALPKKFHPWTLDTLHNHGVPSQSIVRRTFHKQFLDSIATLPTKELGFALSTLTYPLTLRECVQQLVVMEPSMHQFISLYESSLPANKQIGDESSAAAIKLLTKNTITLQAALFWIERAIDGTYDQFINLITSIVPRDSRLKTGSEPNRQALQKGILHSAFRYNSDWCAEESTFFTGEMQQEIVQTHLNELLTTAQAKGKSKEVFGQYDIYKALSDNPAFPQISPTLYYYYLGTRDKNSPSQEPYFWEHVVPTLSGSFEKYAKTDGTLTLRMNLPFVKGSSGIDPIAVLISPTAREFDIPIPFQDGEVSIITHTKETSGTHIYTHRTVYSVPQRKHLTLIHDEHINDGGKNSLTPRHSTKASIRMVVNGDTLLLTEDFEERAAIGLRSRLIETPIFLGSLNPPRDTTVALSEEEAMKSPETISFLISSTHKKELITVSVFGTEKILLETNLSECN